MAAHPEGPLDRGPVFGRGDDETGLGLPYSFIKESGDGRDKRVDARIELNGVVVSG